MGNKNWSTKQLLHWILVSSARKYITYIYVREKIIIYYYVVKYIDKNFPNILK